MFDFIKPKKTETHGFLKKAFWIGTLVSALFETVRYFRNEDNFGGALYGFVSLLVFFWILEVFKDGVHEATESLGEAESAAYSSKRTFDVDLVAPPTFEDIERISQRLTQVLTERFPGDSGAVIVSRTDPRFLFTTDVWRSSWCSCEIAAILKIKNNPIEESPQGEKVTHSVGTLTLSVERQSDSRQIVNGFLVFMVISGVVLSRLDKEAVGSFLVGITLLVAVPVYILAWYQSTKWFPDNLLATLQLDVRSVLAEHSLLKARGDADVSRTPFWSSV